jgi:hypothetical protein
VYALEYIDDEFDWDHSFYVNEHGSVVVWANEADALAHADSIAESEYLGDLKRYEDLAAKYAASVEMRVLAEQFLRDSGYNPSRVIVGPQQFVPQKPVKTVHYKVVEVDAR